MGLLTCLLPGPSLAETDKLLSFDGRIDFKKSQLELNFQLPQADKLSFQLKKIKAEDYQINVKVDHLQVLGYDLSSVIKTKITRVQDGQDLALSPGTDNNPLAFLLRNNLKGQVTSKYTLLNYQPIRDLYGQFALKNNRLVFSHLAIGQIICQGSIRLESPFEVDLDLKVAPIAMKDFLAFWGGDEKQDVSGFVVGTINATGTLNQIALKANLESQEGHVDQLKFNRLYLNMDGIYPYLDVLPDSRVYQTNGLSFRYKGPFNLADRLHFQDQISALMISPIIEGSDSEAEWTLKRIDADDTATMELKYQLRKNKYKGLMNEDDSDLFGIERTMKF